MLMVHLSYVFQFFVDIMVFLILYVSCVMTMFGYHIHNDHEYVVVVIISGNHSFYDDCYFIILIKRFVALGTNRVLYGFPCSSFSGIYSNKQGLLFVK